MKNYKCTRCGELKPKKDFNVRKFTKKGITSECKVCRKERYSGPYNHGAYIKRTYGIDQQKYNEMFKNQEGCCAICGEHQSTFKNSLSVDHNHETQKVRGLLCQKCNLILGHIESVDVFDFIDYLERTN